MTVHGCSGHTVADAFVLKAHSPFGAPAVSAKQPVMLAKGFSPANFKARDSQACLQKLEGTSVMPCLAHVVVAGTSMNLSGRGAGGGGVCLVSVCAAFRGGS